MATKRVWSGATGAANGDSWTDAYVTLQAALTALTTLGDIALVHQTHSEAPSADTNLAVNGTHTEVQPLQIIVVDKDNSDLPVSDYQASGNAEIDVTAGHYHLRFTGGAVHVWGHRFISEDAVSGSHFTSHCTYERCLWQIIATSDEDLTIDNGIIVRFKDSDIILSNAATNTTFSHLGGDDGGQLLVEGGSIATSNSNARLVEYIGVSNGHDRFEGVDLTGLDTGMTLVSIAGAVESMSCKFINCTLPGTEPALITGSLSNLRAGSEIVMTHDEPYRMQLARHNGTAIEETTIRRSGGASDGSIAYSLKIESDSNARESNPFKILLACQNYGNLSGKTLKIHFAQNSGSPTAIKDIDIWLEVSAAQASAQDWRSTRALPLAAGSDHTDESGSEDWRNGGGALSGYTEQSISASGFGTTQGLVYVWLCVARDFTTDNLYVCPKIEIA